MDDYRVVGELVKVRNGRQEDDGARGNRDEATGSDRGEYGK